MAANQAQKQKEHFKPERAFMRGPHSSQSADMSTVAEKADLDQVDKPKRKWYDIGFPTSVYFIISNEFCERFTYYGMKAILTLYLLNGLGYDQSTTVVIYHAFSMLCYFTPIFGGMIADVWWGKYLTIVILSIVYALGNCATAFTSFNDFELAVKTAGCFAGLVLIGIGTGGIKPCVSSFGADQIPEEDTEVRSRFFASFYFAINAGSMLSMIITPILRTSVECGGGPCFPLAFGVPAALMVVAIVVFLIGTPLYIRAKPKGNVIVEVFKCISRAFSNWRKHRKSSPKPEFLDYAEDRFDKQFIADIRACKRIIIMMLPVPVFWALFDQTGSTWTLQGQKMDGTLGSIYILPDQFQVINPALVMLMIPLFQAVIYPCFNKCNLFLPNRLLQRMVAGGVLASLAFVVAAVIQNLIEPTAYAEAPHGTGWIQFVNADGNCPYKVLDGDEEIIKSLSPLTASTKFAMDRKKTSLRYRSLCDNNDILYEINDIAVPDRTTRVIVLSNQDHVQVDNPNPFEDSTGLTRILWINAADTYSDQYSEINIIDSLGSKWNISSPNKFTVITNGGKFFGLSIEEHTFSIQVMDKDEKEVFNGELGKYKNGIDASDLLLLNYNASATNKFNMIVIPQLPPKSWSMFLMVPQYIVLTCAEILFSVSGLDFAYSQAPISMRSVMMAVWLLTVAFGNLIVLVLAEIEMFGPPGMSLFYAALMAVDILIFAIMAYFYVYIDQVESKGNDASSDSSHSDSITGTPPPGYPSDSDHEKYAPTNYPGHNNKSYVEVDEETNL